MKNKGFQGLPGQLKERLIQQALERRTRRVDKELRAQTATSDIGSVTSARQGGAVPERHYRFHLHPGYQQIRIVKEGGSKLGIESPYFRAHEGVADSHTRIAGREFVNYSSYNYLALSGAPSVNAAAKAAIDRYGTSVSASRPATRSWACGFHRRVFRPGP